MLPTWKATYLQSLEGHTNDVTWCDFSGRTLATSSNDKTVRVWIMTSSGQFEESPLSPFLGHTYSVNCVRFSAFGTVLASCSIDGSIILWNVQTGQQIAQLQHPSGSAVRICCFSPSSTLLATGGDDEIAVLWDISTRSAVRTLEGHEAMVTTCAFSPDSVYLMTCSSAGDLKLWDARYGHGKCLSTRFEAHDLGVLGCDFSPQCDANAGTGSLCTLYVFASCGNDDLIKLWHVRTGLHCSITLCLTLEGHTANVMCCRFSADGSILASTAGDKTVILWEPGSGQMIQKLEEHSRYVTSCAFSGNGQLLATGSNDRTVIIWALESTQGKTTENGLDGPPVLLTTLYGPHAGAVAAEWTTNDVCSWLGRIGLEQYAENFTSNSIDGQELMHLNHDNLQAVLKIEALGHRNKILRSIQALRNPLWQHRHVSDEDSTLPNEFFCPITQEVMKDPVVVADGYSYEKEAIAEWLASGNVTSPMTNEALEHTLLIPNKALRLLIQKYLA